MDYEDYEGYADAEDHYEWHAPNVTISDTSAGWEYNTDPAPQVCPTCGKCPTCGDRHGGAWFEYPRTPYYPFSPNYWSANG